MRRGGVFSKVIYDQVLSVFVSKSGSFLFHSDSFLHLKKFNLKDTN